MAEFCKMGNRQYFCHTFRIDIVYLTMKTIIGKNLKLFRNACGYKEQMLADLLGIQRSAYANYEAGIREMPLQYLEKVADLFGCELSTLFSKEVREEEILLSAFRANDLSTSDLEQIASFKGMVKSYLKMKRLSGNE